MAVIKKIQNLRLFYTFFCFVIIILTFFFYFNFLNKFSENINSFSVSALKVVLPLKKENIFNNFSNFTILPKDFNKKIYLNLFTLENKRENTEKKVTDIEENAENILKSVPKYELPHKEEETFKITECIFGNNGIKCDNFFINNKTNLNLNFKEKLNNHLSLKVQKNNVPQVLVVHTHTSESYMDKDQGFYYKGTNFHSTNNKRNVVLVGDAICSVMEKNGIKTIHNSTYHDVPMYTGSYKRAAQTIEKVLAENPSIKVVLDIHRDTIEYSNKRKIKPTVKVNGRKAAQIMIISGCDTDGTLEHPKWQENLKFTLKLQREIETLYPNLTRSLLFMHARYNQHLTIGSTLMEIGTDANTLEEAVYSGILVGTAISRLLNRL